MIPLKFKNDQKARQVVFKNSPFPGCVSISLDAGRGERENIMKIETESPKTMGSLLMIIGFVVLAIGNILFLIAAFSESVLWGLACLFVPVVGLFFLIIHWDKAKTPFLIELAGTGIVLLGFLPG